MPIQDKNIIAMLVTCVLAGLVLTILAPFGTDNFEFIYRLLYWIGLCMAGGIGAGLADGIAYVIKRQFSPWPRAFLQSVTASVLVGSVVLIMTNYAYGMPSIKQALNILMYVWVISMTISSIGALISSKDAADAASENLSPERAALYERLKPKLRRAEIFALAAEDHYVRVITSKGDDLILMRLSDAIKEISPIKGLATHRSWWVAEAGAEKIKKSEIFLPTGQIAPISRSGMKSLRKAGWV